MSLALGYTEHMGPRLRSEVERQLLLDLAHYRGHQDGLWIDWSDTCPEGHVTQYLDGGLENWSGVVVRDQASNRVAEGWLEFIHGGGDHPLFVFWEYLTIVDRETEREVKRSPGIPLHVWEQLPEGSRWLCTHAETYDAQWRNDPLVVAWKRKQEQQ